MCIRDSAEIGHGDQHILSVAAGIDVDRLVAAVFHGIVEQVEQDLAEQHAVALDKRQVRRDAGLDRPAREILALSLIHI